MAENKRIRLVAPEARVAHNNIDNCSLQIYVLSRDRAEYLHAMLVSAMPQVGEHVELIVSDNSLGEDVANMLLVNFPQVRCVRRNPPLTASDHFRTVIQEANADLLVMFHDDDILMARYVQTLRGFMDRNPEIAAVCPNALVMRGAQITDECFSPKDRGDLRLEKPEDMLMWYFSLSLKGAAPFPGYMYRRSKIQGLYLDPKEGGKYADVSFLLKVLQRGPIMWLHEPLMLYRIHKNNDSAREVVGHRLALLRYIYATTPLTRKSQLVARYRYGYWLSWILSGRFNESLGQRWRLKVVKSFIFRRTLTLAITDIGFWLYGLYKVKVLLRKIYNRNCQ